MRALASQIVQPIVRSQPEIVYRRFERGELTGEVALTLPGAACVIAALALGVGYWLGQADAA